LRTIYIKDVPTRKLFIELGGLQLLYDLLVSGDVDIILEVLYNIEDLIYVNKKFFDLILKNFREKKMNTCRFRKL
jgi:hypothetical protein